MKISEVVSLLKAGYSKKEIEELRASENVEPTVTIEHSNQPEEAALNTLAEAATKTASETVLAPASPGIGNAEVLQAIKDLTKTLQLQNVRSDAIEPVKPQTAVDILGTVINGYGKE